MIPYAETTLDVQVGTPAYATVRLWLDAVKFPFLSVLEARKKIKDASAEHLWSDVSIIEIAEYVIHILGGAAAGVNAVQVLRQGGVGYVKYLVPWDEGRSHMIEEERQRLRKYAEQERERYRQAQGEKEKIRAEQQKIQAEHDGWTGGV